MATAVETALQAWATTLRAAAQDAILNAVAAAFRTDRRGFADLTVDLPRTSSPVSRRSCSPSRSRHRSAGRGSGRQGVDLPPAGPPVIDLQAFAGSMLQLLVKSMVTTASGKPSPRTPHPARRRTTWRRRSRELDDAHPRAAAGHVRRDHVVRAGDRAARGVLATAPAGTYVASEIMDANTCRPCAAIDGHRVPVPGGRRRGVRVGRVLGVRRWSPLPRHRGDDVGLTLERFETGAVLVQWEDGTIVSYGAGTMFGAEPDGERCPLIPYDVHRRHTEGVPMPNGAPQLPRPPRLDADASQRTHLGVTLLV